MSRHEPGDTIQLRPSVDLEGLRRFARQELLRASREGEKDGRFPLELYRGLHAAGWLQAFVPASFGGAGLSTVDLACIASEIAYGSPGVATSVTANMMGVLPVLLHGNQLLARELAEQVLGSLSLSSFCWTEPDTGSDVFRIRTRAARVEGGYRLSGQKCFITNANHADRYLVMARIEGAPTERSLTLFHVPKGAPGLRTGLPLQKLGHWESNTSEVYLDQVFVPEKEVIGEPGKGPEIAIHCLQRNRSIFAAGAVGLSRRALDLARDYLMSRRLHGGKPLLAQPAIQAQLARLHTEAEAAWLLVCQAASQWDRGFNECRASSMAKLFAGNVAVRVSQEVLELFGGYGYTRDFEIEKLYRDAKLYEIIEGPSLVQQALIARELFPEARESAAAGIKRERGAA